MSIIVLDNFSEDESHGEIVVDTIEQTYDGNIHAVGLGSSSVSVELINEKLGYINEKIISDDWGEVSAVNLSFGGSAARYPWGTKTFYPDLSDRIQKIFSEDIDVTFSAGNSGEIFSGVSIISTTPFNWSVGALNEENKIADYSQHHPWLTDGWAYGVNEAHDARGTSFSSPRLAGTLAEVKEEYDLTLPEARTAYEMTSDYFVSNHEQHKGEGYWQLDYDELVNINGAFDVNPTLTIDAAYEVFLRRQPDESGRDWWSDKLHDEDQVIKSLIDTALENNDFYDNESPGGSNHGRAAPVVEYAQAHYHLFLDREADTEGLEWWTSHFVDKQYGDIEDFAQFTESFIEAAQENNEDVQLVGVAEQYFDLATTNG